MDSLLEQLLRGHSIGALGQYNTPSGVIFVYNLENFPFGVKTSWILQKPEFISKLLKLSVALSWLLR
jgi:hypothetical protein